jgi:simple sugar transport system substrate-binding protein
MERKIKRVMIAVLAMTLTAAAVGGCGGGGGSSTSSGDVSSSTVASTEAAGHEKKFILVSHSPSTDPYWAVVAQGLEQAGSDFGVETEYRGVQANLQDPNEEQRLIQAAIASHPDGLIVTDPYPESLNSAIKEASDAGIPTILINSGIGEARNTGALTVIANDEKKSGELGGELMKELGAQHPLIVDTPPGAIPLVDERTEGFENTVGVPSEQVQIPVNEIDNSGFIKNAVEAELAKDSSIDAVFSTGSAFSPAILEARNGLGSRGESMHWGAIDPTEQIIKAMVNDEWDFVLDQQQFSQSYLAVSYLVLETEYGITPATEFLPTGPGVITPKNAKETAELEEIGVR